MEITGNVLKSNNKMIIVTDRGRFIKILKSVFFICIISLHLQISGCTTLSKDHNAEPVVTSEEPGIEEKWGISIIGVRLTAAGYMLDFRYRVLNPEKAAPILSSKVKPFLIEQTSGRKMLVPNLPKVGSLRQRGGTSESGWTSFILFSNPGKLVKSSDQVTVVIGDLRVENLVVE